ncbi:MAG: hypothetical protein LBS97_06820 [Treponema sp.]|jgi:hypothetical protein|nr:hypothetical protein [Treponema sp.]
MKKLSGVLLALVIFSTAVYAADPLPVVPPPQDLTGVQSNLNNFLSTVFTTLPNSAVQQNISAEAFIGKLLPSVPPHFNAGLTFGVARLPMGELLGALDGLTSAANTVNNIPGVSTIPGIDIINTVVDFLDAARDNVAFPSVTFNGRIGGFFLPFDLGFSFMMIPSIELESLAFDYFSLDINARYAILEESLLLPTVSVGIGYNHMAASINTGSDNLGVNTDLKTDALYGLVQISKTILILTPYIGFNAIFAGGDGDWEFKFSQPFTVAGHTGDIAKGLKGTVSQEFGELYPQLFGGLAFKFGFIQMTLGGSYDLLHKIWGASLSTRFKM